MFYYGISFAAGGARAGGGAGVLRTVLAGAVLLLILIKCVYHIFLIELLDIVFYCTVPYYTILYRTILCGVKGYEDRTGQDRTGCYVI